MQLPSEIFLCCEQGHNFTTCSIEDGLLVCYWNAIQWMGNGEGLVACGMPFDV